MKHGTSNLIMGGHIICTPGCLFKSTWFWWRKFELIFFIEMAKMEYILLNQKDWIWIW